MNDEEFKRLLSEYTEWRIPETITGTKDGTAKTRSKKINDPEPEMEEQDLFDSEAEPTQEHNQSIINETFPPMVLKVKCTPTTCEDCGKYCENGRQKEAKLYQKNGKAAWRQKCLTCRKFQNPFTGKFELSGSAASTKFNDFMRETKGAYKTKANAQREKLLVKVKTDQIENDQEIITFYHHHSEEK